ncbi:type 4b pilus protein PilO2 [Polynucleobacter sp. JS-Safj-400b-B2]|uniref:type 4b pilus protein PilO2 n=1 Tax=Polynucleobacter sp. JS-Safj-400b-B2 TaxID=2576921 RepID=UPI001C0B90C0|nr:type 4b pilus protein PilO2 [Polynucleobacter sp. JS-Safj-400b-B2]MBU3625967.1 type 4b pilus protein PilO2 [Polynucleobacter sp. JS-Safj-400b-B2]
MQVFKLLGKSMVAGLNWEPLPIEIEAGTKKYIQKLAEEQDFNLYTLIKGVETQTGFASSHEKLSGKYSIASILFQVFSGSEHSRDIAAILEIHPDSYLYYGQKDGLILYDGDLAGSRQDALDRLNSHIALYGPFEVLYAPESLEIENSTHATFETILGDSFFSLRRLVGLSQARVRPCFLDKKRRNTYIVIGILAVILLAASSRGFVIYQANEAAARLQLEQERISKAMEENAPKPIYQTLPTSYEMVSACLSLINEHDLIFPNWNLVAIECSQSGMVASLTKSDEGRYEDLISKYPDSIVNLAANTATIKISQIVTANYVGKITLPSMSDVYLNTDKAISYGIEMKYKPAASSVNLPGQDLIPKKVAELDWIIDKTPFTPDRVIDLMDNSGLRISKITKIFGANGSSWSLEGTQYAQQ